MVENGVTFINVIELPADEVDAFVEQWRERAKLMRDAPGFRDSRLHRAQLPDTRFQLVNVAHWDSAEAWEAATGQPGFRAAMRGVPGVVSPNPALYDVVVEFERP
ncbi:antibiotic biosynthesis monooxygenase family protein [Amycolatopsis viridis]|uniref:Heme-degrading monooxygenase HmoA n=1 Tax=Amycolatopsis viridis TaxID=185678 RepID=A0ABX0SXR9_9PSEU|nr:antibiotic biosynthesis monooxygenase family protein [Amycolatopsis viridis]NIH80320.1 heme-degrading monooxygenase HmoA [Amycolatopsis viridis]